MTLLFFFSVTEKFYRTAIKARWLTKLRLRNPLAKAQAAKSGALAGSKQVITWTAAKEARDNSVEVILFAPNTRKNFERYCIWPVDALITDYPDMGHCP